jgi:hypothetical protein
MSNNKEEHLPEGVETTEYGEDKLIVSIQGQKYFLKVQVPENFDTDRVSSIDYSNMVGEILTVNYYLNTVGLLLAKAEQDFRLAKMNFEIFEAKQRQQVREELSEMYEIEAGTQGKKAKRPTIQEVDDALVKSAKYKQKKTELIEAEYAKDVVNSVYWSIKNKSEILLKLSTNIGKEDVESYIEKNLNKGGFTKLKNKKNG